MKIFTRFSPFFNSFTSNRHFFKHFLIVSKSSLLTNFARISPDFSQFFKNFSIFSTFLRFWLEFQHISLSKCHRVDLRGSTGVVYFSSTDAIYASYDRPSKASKRKKKQKSNSDTHQSSDSKSNEESKSNDSSNPIVIFSQ